MRMPPLSAGPVPSDRPAASTSEATPSKIDWRDWLARRAAAIQPYAVMAWLAGVVALSGRLLVSVLGVRRLVRGRLPVSVELAAYAIRLSQRLGLSASPGVFVSKRIREAMLVGLWRPLVLLPAAWIAEMPPDVLEAVIAHELAHVRRLDLWANLLQRLVETLLFYHPAVWWLSLREPAAGNVCRRPGRGSHRPANDLCERARASRPPAAEPACSATRGGHRREKNGPLRSRPQRARRCVWRATSGLVAGRGFGPSRAGRSVGRSILVGSAACWCAERNAHCRTERHGVERNAQRRACQAADAKRHDVPARRGPALGGGAAEQQRQARCLRHALAHRSDFGVRQR